MASSLTALLRRLRRSRLRAGRGAGPDPIALVHRPGPDPLRILLFGGGLLAGERVVSHEAGLPGAVADELHDRLRRGVDLTVVVERDLGRESARTGLVGLRTARFDAVVLVAGPLRAHGDAHALDLLLALAADESAPAAAVAVFDAGALGGPGARGAQHRSSDHLRVALRDLPRLRRVVATPPATVGDGPFAPEDLRHWAEQVVDAVHERILRLPEQPTAATPRAHRDQRVPEELRQRALGVLRLGRERDPVLDGIVREARDAFGTRFAAVNVVDGRLRWQKAASFPETTITARSATICDFAIQRDGPTVINDIRDDPRAKRTALARTARFYAAVPIHSWDGYRIGTLCVYDPAPRAMRTAEAERLRDFASRVEQRLWASALR